MNTEVILCFTVNNGVKEEQFIHIAPIHKNSPAILERKP